MKNKGISDFVAASMNAVLNSEQHKSLFNTQYKFASASAEDKDHSKDMHSAKTKAHKCAKCGEESCSCMPAWDKDHAHDEHSAKSHKCSECGKDQGSCYCMPADDELLPADDDNFGDDKPVVSPDGKSITFPPDVIKGTVPKQQSAADHEMKTSAALDVAIDSLLTASAALDSVGMANGSTLSLKLASLVVEAKKKMSPAEKKKLMERLQKGKKGKKPAASSSSSSSSKSSSSSSDKSSSSSSGKSSAKSSEVSKKK